MTERKNYPNEQAADGEFVIMPVGKCFQFVCAEIQFEEARILFGGSQASKRVAGKENRASVPEINKGAWEELARLSPSLNRLQADRPVTGGPDGRPPGDERKEKAGKSRARWRTLTSGDLSRVNAAARHHKWLGPITWLGDFETKGNI
jgi:hypothetical protein